MQPKFPWLSALVVLWIGGAPASGEESLPEPGPENGGLRLRLMIQTDSRPGQDTHHVQLDILNVTEQPITLTANWPYEHGTGSVKEYLEEATSMDIYPRVYQEVAQTMEDARKSSQPQYVLKPKDVLTVRWDSAGGRLKKAKYFQGLENATFPSDGLYAVHAMVTLGMTGGECLLRSNEQQVSVGGSRKMPRHMCATVLRTDEAKRTAAIDVGSLHGVKAGDRFVFRTGMSECWCLTVSTVYPGFCHGVLSESDYWGRPPQKEGGRALPWKGQHGRCITAMGSGGEQSGAAQPAR